MKKLIVAAVFGVLSTTGCLKVIEGDKVYSVQATKFIFGKDIVAAENAIPAGATITTVNSSRALFGLIQGTVISGTK